MSRPCRAIRAINNRNREFLDEPLLPEPEDGYAPEERPAGWQAVEDWFRDATSGQPHRRRKPRLPDTRHADRIARLVNEWHELLARPHEPLAEVVAARARRLRGAFHKFKAELSGILIAAGEPTNDPAISSLIDLSNALDRAEAYVGPPPKQGRQLQPWQVIARALEAPVRSALASGGHHRASITADGPMVKVIAAALNAIEGADHPPETIASWLKRGRKRRGTKS